MKTLNNIKKIWGAALIGIASFMLLGCQEAAQKGDGLLMTGTSSDRLVKFAIDGFPSAYAVSVTSTSRVESDIQVNLAVDASLVDTYNEEMGTNYYPIPDKSYTLKIRRLLFQQDRQFLLLPLFQLPMIRNLFRDVFI